MQSELSRRVADLVQQGLRARSAFYASIDLPDEQALGAPANSKLIASLEAKLGCSLPPSYKAFLGLHNGWRMVDAETDLLSIDEMLGGPRAVKVKTWQQQAEKWDDKVAAKGVVIGHSNISQSRIILDPTATNSEGEWRLIERYKDEEEVYESFLVWLERSAADYKAIVESPDNDAGEPA